MMTRFPHGFVLTVMSDDHPGIVAAVSNAVESLGGNIDSCSQTVLGGYFTLIMIVSVPEPIEPEQLACGIRGAESRGAGYQVLVRPAQVSDNSTEEVAERFVISAFGEDQPGIVRRFSQYLAGKDINIVDRPQDKHTGLYRGFLIFHSEVKPNVKPFSTFPLCGRTDSQIA